jgi:hypothetical protein
MRLPTIAATATVMMKPRAAQLNQRFVATLCGTPNADAVAWDGSIEAPALTFLPINSVDIVTVH